MTKEQKLKTLLDNLALGFHFPLHLQEVREDKNN